MGNVPVVLTRILVASGRSVVCVIRSFPALSDAVKLSGGRRMPVSVMGNVSFVFDRSNGHPNHRSRTAAISASVGNLLVTAKAASRDPAGQ